jgi:hypothetical protein
VFWYLAKRTGGRVLPFDARAPGRLRGYSVGGSGLGCGWEKLQRERRHELPGAVALLEKLMGKGVVSAGFEPWFLGHRRLSVTPPSLPPLRK